MHQGVDDEVDVLSHGGGGGYAKEWMIRRMCLAVEEDVDVLGSVQGDGRTGPRTRRWTRRAVYEEVDAPVRIQDGRKQINGH